MAISPPSIVPSSSSYCCFSLRSFFAARYSSLLLLLFTFLTFFLFFQLDFVSLLLPHTLSSWPSYISRHFQPSPLPSLTTHPSLLPNKPPLRPPSSTQSSPRPLPLPSMQTASHSSRQTPLPSSNQSRIAVCLVGGARAFELTGPSIIKYLLRVNNNTDVFVHAPLDKDARKLYLLKDVPNLVRVRIFKPQRLPEKHIYKDVLTASHSPNGIQGLLQYFNLVEECLNMIKQHQSNHSFVYDWIIRTRLDGYWSAHVPSLNKMNHAAYTVPSGSQFGGLNDRLGIGNWETSKVALSRLSLLPTLHDHGLRQLNSESAFRQQLRVRHVKLKHKKFPFCILSHRRYGWPPGPYGVPVVSISSKGPLNGAKCRPCTPVATGGRAKSIIDGLVKFWAWTDIDYGVELCQPTHDWETHWEDIFDRVAGPEFQAIRREIQYQNLKTCVEANELFKKHVTFWDAMSPTAICEQGLTS